jgi:hypothetical protein
VHRTKLTGSTGEVGIAKDRHLFHARGDFLEKLQPFCADAILESDSATIGSFVPGAGRGAPFAIAFAALLKPDLTPAERTAARVEGWILGVPGLISIGHSAARSSISSVSGR